MARPTKKQTETLTAFLSSHPTAVISTCDREGNPAAAVVLFAEDGDLSLVFGTHPTRKYQNLKANPKAAFAMTQGMTALQIHADVHELSGQAAEEARSLFLKKHPEMDQHLVEGSVFFRARPNWLRYMDMSQRPWDQWEVSP